MTKFTLCVSGVGEVIGQGIIKNIKSAFPDAFIVGHDTNPRAVGRYWCHDFFESPKVEDASFADFLRTLTGKYEFDIYFSGMEQELDILPQIANTLSSKSFFLLNNLDLIKKTRDKFDFFEEFKTVFPRLLIPTFRLAQIENLMDSCAGPYIAKPRRGYASKSQFIASNFTESFISEYGNSHIIQPFYKSKREITYSVFGNGHGEILAELGLERELSGSGSTKWARPFYSSELKKMVKLLSSHLKPLGPTNLQFLELSDGFRLLEINPRISSSTSIRGLLGYNEAELCIRYFLNHEKILPPKVRNLQVLRYVEDYVL